MNNKPVWVEGHYNSGDLTDQKCPECESRILYNGNYFCENWGWNSGNERLGGPCDWALPHPQERLIDKQISFRLVGYWEWESKSGNEYAEVRVYPGE